MIKIILGIIIIALTFIAPGEQFGMAVLGGLLFGVGVVDVCDEMRDRL